MSYQSYFYLLLMCPVWWRCFSLICQVSPYFSLSYHRMVGFYSFGLAFSFCRSEKWRHGTNELMNATFISSMEGTLAYRFVPKKERSVVWLYVASTVPKRECFGAPQAFWFQRRNVLHRGASWTTMCCPFLPPSFPLTSLRGSPYLPLPHLA